MCVVAEYLHANCTSVELFSISLSTYPTIILQASHSTPPPKETWRFGKKCVKYNVHVHVQIKSLIIHVHVYVHVRVHYTCIHVHVHVYSILVWYAMHFYVTIYNVWQSAAGLITCIMAGLAA